jgi:hypothetical protein
MLFWRQRNFRTAEMVSECYPRNTLPTMSISLEPYDFQSDAPQPNSHSFYDFAKDILLPAIPAIGMVLSWKSPLRFAVFGAATLAYSAVQLYPRVVRWRRLRNERKRDTDAAAEGLQTLRQLN